MLGLFSVKTLRGEEKKELFVKVILITKWEPNIKFLMKRNILVQCDFYYQLSHPRDLRKLGENLWRLGGLSFCSWGLVKEAAMAGVSCPSAAGSVKHTGMGSRPTRGKMPLSSASFLAIFISEWNYFSFLVPIFLALFLTGVYNP